MPSAVDPGESSQPEARSGPARAHETDDGTARHETEADRLDRTFDELLEEQRVS